MFRVVWRVRRVRRNLQGSRGEYMQHKEQARALAVSRLQLFNEKYGFSIKKISIKNQKTMWGSCSRKGNLNFHYKIALLPDYLADYIIVHELCHLEEFNHSRVFWGLVARSIPNHRELRGKLKHHKDSNQ